MGRLARIALELIHFEGKTEWVVSNDDAGWLIETLNDARRTIRDYEDALGQKGHVIELTEFGWAIEHTVECRAGGILNCPIHMKVTTHIEDFGPPVAGLDDGRYFVTLEQDGSMKFVPLP
jgi:CTP-dependent riboflavin kinase